MEKIDRINMEKIIAGEITPRDCLIAGLLDPYATLGWFMGGSHRLNSILIKGVGDYCANASAR